MEIESIENLQGCTKVPLVKHQDDRGYFQETWNEIDFNRLLGKKIHFVQDNNSLSQRDVLRGLHFQNPFPQSKLLRVLSGAILDVVVDLRRSSETFGDWSSIEISEKSNFQLWIPIGFAHGFIALQNNTNVSYKVTEFWNREAEQTLLWNDPKLSIQWKSQGEPIVSEKDSLGLPFSDLTYFD